MVIETEPAAADTEPVKQIFDGIGSALDALVNALNEITGAAREIGAGNVLVKMQKRSEQDELIQARQDVVEKLKEIIADVRSASDQVAASSQELTAQASHLQEIIAFFKVDTEARVRQPRRSLPLPSPCERKRPLLAGMV